LRATQFSLLSRIAELGPIALNQLAEAMIMDRATLGHNVRPLEARALIRLAVGKDRRSHEVSVTAKGRELIGDARVLWQQAQRSFESELGRQEASALRAVLKRIAATEFTLV
jgi:DNA-binding MarR family transcriptional regulator